MSVMNVPIKNIWMLSREYGGLAGAGGVKDVAKQLSCALARWTGRRVSVVMPLYGFVVPKACGFSPLMDPIHPEKQVTYNIDMNYIGEERRERVWVWHARIERVRLYLLATDRFQEKGDVYTYTQDEESGDPWKKQGEGHYDYFAMNILLQKAAIELMILLGEKPDIIHCHDAHTAVLPAIINESSWLRSYFRETGTVVTIHNAGRGYHQEVLD
ncbi:MAG: glycogen/starch synthase, partial [Gammaproteobacteria bacterium]|nr:glycogen/starch synthase [Gammaproteobacteria bacterium]